MTCNIISTRGAVFVLWGVPTKEDIDRVVQSLRVVFEQTQKPVVYVTRIPTDQPAPSSEVRRYMNGMMPTFVECLSSYHVALEGVGFAAAVKRAVLLGLFQLTWRRKTFFVHSRVEEIESSLEPHERAAVAAVLSLAKARGLLEANGPLQAAVQASSQQ